jgi:hypothetical protein
MLGVVDVDVVVDVLVVGLGRIISSSNGSGLIPYIPDDDTGVGAG